MIKKVIALGLVLGLATLYVGAPAGDAPAAPTDGFVTYSEGDTDQRTLYLRRFAAGELQVAQLITEKGTGGDIMGTVSFDGRWLAFARNSAPAGPDNARDGQWRGFENEDYHKFHAWDIYVVRLDGELPAKAQRVGQGYWPSWGTNSSGTKKTLYYGNYLKGSIMRASVDDSGVVEQDLLHSSIPGWESGDHHMQTAPDGRSVAIRIGNHMWLKGLAGNDINQRLGPGCHPSWMADSQWLYHANTQLWHVSLGNSSGRQGGAYHFGSSVDQQWAVTISDFDDNAQNRGWPLHVYAIDNSREKISLHRAPSADISTSGSWPDIHTL